MELKPKTTLQVAGIYILLVLSIIMVIVSAYLTHYNTVEKATVTQSVIRRYQLIQSAIQLFSYLKDENGGQHGYLITSDSSFIESYNKARKNFTVEADKLEKLVRDDVDPEVSLLEKKIIASMNGKQKDLEIGINILHRFGRDSMARRLSTRIGKRHMDTVRTYVQDLIKHEQMLLSQENENLQAKTRVEDNVRFIAFSLIGLISLAAFVTLSQKQRHIRGLIGDLRKINEELEEKVLQRTKQLVEANEAKDHFLSIASHDLKVPIAGIQGLLSLLRSDKREKSESEIEYLSYMEDSCNSMQRLISNLLDINRIERGETIVSMQQVDIHNFLSRLEKPFIHQAKTKNIELRIEKIDGVIKTDPDALSRVLENLLSNALKFSGVGKMVTLKASYHNNHFKFEIIDEGPGISAEEIKLLFGKFQKLSNKPTGGEGSTGLGLSIAKELTNLLGGEITVVSVIGKGTTFTVSIPVN